MADGERVAGQISSDAGLLPLRPFDQCVGLTRAFADALDDASLQDDAAGPNEPDRERRHSPAPELRQRGEGLSLGRGSAVQEVHEPLDPPRDEGRTNPRDPLIYEWQGEALRELTRARTLLAQNPNLAFRVNMPPCGTLKP
jgi:hypothetical protein